MSDDIQPALTPEEWETWRDNGYVDRGSLSLHTKGRGFAGLQRVTINRCPMPADVECHAVAAAMLDRQPFGFTRDDVALVLDLQHHLLNGIGFHDLIRRQAEIVSLIARIAALLPPEPNVAPDDS